MCHTSRAVFLSLYGISLISLVSAQYCEWDLCKPWQYCCRTNECCNVTDFNKLVWIAVILGTVTVLILFCSWFYCKSRRSNLLLRHQRCEKNYTKLQDPQTPQTTVVIQ